MRYEAPQYFHELKEMSVIRTAIRACAKESPHRAVTALLRIRNEQHAARTIDLPYRRFVSMYVPLLLLTGALTRPSPAVFALAAAGSGGWWFTMGLYNRRYPHRDEKDIPERKEIDAMVRLALEGICEKSDLADLSLNLTERKQVLCLFAGQPLPNPLRQAIIRQLVPVSFPDV